MKKMTACLKTQRTYLLVALTVALFLVFAASAVAATESFFVDPGFDKFNRKNVEAVFVYEGNKAKYYAEKPFWDTQSVSLRNQHLRNIKTLSNTFDTQIYHNLTRVFGLEWTPGIDNDPKLTVLFLRTKNNLGGFFRVQDEYPVTEIPNSNEREMVFLSFDFLNQERQIAGFLAHEFQHVINFNQKTRLRGVVEERWLNELLSEIAPSIVGLDDLYEGSNLKFRVNTFLKTPNDPLIIWDNEEEDYAVINLFGQYLRDHYGDQFFTLVGLTEKTGVDAINEALQTLGTSKTFFDMFVDWVITILVNDCGVKPLNTYCYLNPNLNSNNLLITFSWGTEGGYRIEQTEAIRPWEGQWFSYESSAQNKKFEKDILALEFRVPADKQFILPYVVYTQNEKPKVRFANISSGYSKFSVEEFGLKVSKVVLMPLNQSTTSIAATQINIVAELVSKKLEDETSSQEISSVMSVGIKEGSLIRAQGDPKVYIIKGPYRRWIQSAEIIDMYGHLRWEDIIEVSSDILDNYITSNVIRFAVDKKVYSVFSSGIKTWIQNEQKFLSLGYNFNMVYEVNEREFAFYRL